MSAKAKYEYHLKNWSDIQDHLPRLREAAIGNCLEIGVRQGVSTSALLAGIEDHGGHLTSIDINDCSHVFWGHPQWNFVRSNTHLMQSDGPHNVLFVDGDHTYHGALYDLRTFGPSAARIFVHDTDAPDYPGVKQAVEEFVRETKRKVIYHPGSFGMAEIV